MKLFQGNGKEKTVCMPPYDGEEGEFIMFRVKVDLDIWDSYKKYTWGEARIILDEVEKQDREDEAMEIIEGYFLEDRIGYIPGIAEVNDFIWFKLPDIMQLYDEDDENDEEEEE